MIFDKEPLHRAPRQYGFSPAGSDRFGKLLSRYAKQSLYLEIRQVLLARPAEQMVRPDIQETEAMPEVIFEPRQDLDAVGKARDACKRKAQQRCRRIDSREQHVAFRQKGGRVLQGPIPEQPLEAAGAHGFHLWLHSGRKLDHQGMARLIALKTVGFGGAGIPGARLDLERAMPITERQIVEIGPLRAIGSDLVPGLAARREIADGAMSKADTQLRAWRFHAVEQLGRIVEMVTMEERCG